MDIKLCLKKEITIYCSPHKDQNVHYNKLTILRSSESLISWAFALWLRDSPGEGRGERGTLTSGSLPGLSIKLHDPRGKKVVCHEV
jgi:hypothetical protein